MAEVTLEIRELSKPEKGMFLLGFDCAQLKEHCDSYEEDVQVIQEVYNYFQGYLATVDSEKYPKKGKFFFVKDSVFYQLRYCIQ